MKLNPTLSVIIPCYNEGKNLPILMERLGEALQARTDIDIILVNNGSVDDSADIMAEKSPKYSFISVVNVPVNKGYGFGILSGLNAAKGEFLGWTHADLQTSPQDLCTAWESILIESNPSRTYVKGNRYGRSPFDVFFTIGMSFFETLFLKTRLWDINAQPNLFHRTFFEKWDNPPFDFSLDLYAYYYAKKLGLKVKRFPVEFPHRIHGHSSWNTGLKAKYKFIVRTLQFSLKLKQTLKK